MGLNDVKYFVVEIPRDKIEDTLLGLAGAVAPYFSRQSQPQTIDELFHTFNEGDKNLSTNNFFVQARAVTPNARISAGRIALSYGFKSGQDTAGELKAAVLDNGENVPEELFCDIYDKLRRYALQCGFKVVKEETKKEY